MDALPNIRPLLESWSIIETWAVRLFIFLGVLTLFPWILLVLFDASLYVWRYLILAPIARFLRLNTYLPETPVTLEHEGEVSTGSATAVRTKQRGSLETGAAPAMSELPDGLDKALKDKDI